MLLENLRLRMRERDTYRFETEIPETRNFHRGSYIKTKAKKRPG